MPLNFLVFILRGGVYWKRLYFVPPVYKIETSNFRGIVPIQFLISIILPIEWALDERYPTKLTFLCIMVILTSSGNMANMYCTKKKLHDNYFFLKEHISFHSKTCKIVGNIILWKYIYLALNCDKLMQLTHMYFRFVACTPISNVITSTASFLTSAVTLNYFLFFL